MFQLTLVMTSARVAPGLLAAPAWDLLRSVPVFCGSPDHPQLGALAEAGVAVEVIDGVPAPAVAAATGSDGHPASSPVASVAPEFVASVRERAGRSGAAAAAWLMDPAHALPAGPGESAGHPAASTPEPVPASAQQAQAQAPGPASSELATTVADAPDGVQGAHVDVLAGTRELPGSALLDAVAVMDRLRSPGGCPWDAEQTHASLAGYLLEEAYEAYQSIEDGNLAELREELGDVLMQVLFHARVASEGSATAQSGAGNGRSLPPVEGNPAAASSVAEGRPMPAGSAAWDVDDVASGLVAKLVRRHPHVFGDVVVDGSAAVVTNWERIKDAEKGRRSVTEGVPLSQPALSLAAKLQKRADKIGIPLDVMLADLAPKALTLDGPDATVPQGGLPADAGDPAAELGRLVARLAGPGQAGDPGPLEATEAIGRLLFVAVALARQPGVDPEAALRLVARRFRDALAAAEDAVRAAGADPRGADPDTWRTHWPA